MKRLIYLLVVVALLMLPAGSAGAEGEVYATSVHETSPTGVTNEGAALDAPDGSYATIGTDGYIILDLASPATGIVTFYFSAASPACQIGMDDGVNAFSWYTLTTTPGSDSYVYAGVNHAEQVGIKCGTLPKKTVFQLDAVQVTPLSQAPNNGYGVQVYSTEGVVRNATAALGAPDQRYATIGADSQITLILGGPQSGILTVYHSAKSPACQIIIFTNDGSSFGYTTPGADSTVFPYLTDQLAVTISCASNKTVFELDAVQVTPLTGFGLLVWVTAGVVRSPTAALGAPDGSYATIGKDSGIALDLGAPLTGDLSIYHSTASPACDIYTDVGGDIKVGSTTSGAASTGISGQTGVRIVEIQCGALAKKSVFQLDAVQVALPTP